MKRLPTPTDEEIADPLFNVIFDIISQWDIGIASAYAGLCSGNGSHAAVLLRAVREAIGSGAVAIDDQHLSSALEKARFEERERIANWLSQSSTERMSVSPTAVIRALNGTLPGEKKS